jgi:hypothetical protein
VKLDASHAQSFSAFGSERLRTLCRGLGLNDQREQEAQKLLSRFLMRWGDAAIGRAPRWRSDITDDHSPFEFSLAMDGREPELRILVEAQAHRPGLLANWEAGRALSNALAEEFGMSLDRLRAIEHLFAPTDPRAKFSIWHAVSLRADSAPEFKIYLNPQAQGRGSSGNIVARALSLLGFPNAVVPRSERSLDEIKYISLDMSNRPDARIKLYAAHHDATVSDIEAALRPASYYVRGEATDFCLHMAGQEGPYTELPVQTCLAYAVNHEAPLMGTIHFPVRSYAPNDEIVRDRILEYLGEPTAQLYRKALDSFSNRPLNEGVGMQTYASLRQQEGGSRMTVYLSPELYSIDDASEMPMSLSPMSMSPISKTTLLQGGEPCPVSGSPASGIMSSDGLQKFRGVTSKNGTG